MKKLISTLFVLGIAGAAYGQNWTYQSFLNEASLTVTNTIQATNLAGIGATTTNVVGLIWTNQAGTRVIAAAGDTHNPFVDCQIWPNSQGSWPAISYTPMYTNSPATWQDSPFSIYLKLIGQSGANSTVTFVAYPIVQDTSGPATSSAGPAGVTKEINATATSWTFSVTANTTTPVTLLTNAPTYLWRGASGIRINRVVNGDTDATSNVTIQDLALVGFRP